MEDYITVDMDDEETYDIVQQLRAVERVYKRAISQMNILNQKIEAAQTRMDMSQEAYSVVQQIRATDKCVRRAISQLALIKNKIEAAETRMNRARSVKRLSNLYRLKIKHLEEMEDHIYGYFIIKCKQMDALLEKMHELTGICFYDSDANDSENTE